MRASRLNSCFSDALVAVAVVVALEDEHLAKRKIIVVLAFLYFLQLTLYKTNISLRGTLRTGT